MVKIKLCGLFREQDIAYANEAAPDYIGFVFAPSRRQVTPMQAALLRARLRADITPVGVFVDAPLSTIATLYMEGNIAIAQLHGHEDAAYITALKALCPMPVIKALHTSDWTVHWEQSAADFFLFDTGSGGTGQTFDWTLLTSLPVMRPYFLAGGITCDNIASALALNPFAVDVSSGAETNSVKDCAKMRALVTAAHEYQ